MNFYQLPVCRGSRRAVHNMQSIRDFADRKGWTSTHSHVAAQTFECAHRVPKLCTAYTPKGIGSEDVMKTATRTCCECVSIGKFENLRTFEIPLNSWNP